MRLSFGSRSRHTFGERLARHRSSTDRNAKRVSTPRLVTSKASLLILSRGTETSVTPIPRSASGGDRDCPLAVLQSQYRYPIRRSIKPTRTGARRCARLYGAGPYRSASPITGRSEWKVVQGNERDAILFRLYRSPVISVYTQSVHPLLRVAIFGRFCSREKIGWTSAERDGHLEIECFSRNANEEALTICRCFFE